MKPPNSKIIPLTKLGWNSPPPEPPDAGRKPGPPSKIPVPPKPALMAGMPDLTPVLYTLNYGQSGFREPENGEFVVGFWPEDDGTAAALLLWADPDVDLFFDLALRKHVNPPGFYLRLAQQPQIDAQTGYPIIDGAICPY